MANIDKKFADQLVKGQVIEGIEVDRYTVLIKLQGGGHIEIQEDGPEDGRLKTEVDLSFRGEVDYQ